MFNWLICHMIVWDLWPSPFAHAFDGIIGHFRHIMNMQMIIGCFEAEHAINKPIDQRHKFLVLRWANVQELCGVYVKLHLQLYISSTY